MKLAVALFFAFAAASDLGAETVALVGGTVHPVSAPEIRSGTVLFVDGKITAVGAAVPLPPGTKVVDVSGKHVYPSLLPAATNLGLVEISAARATVDAAEIGDVNPEARADAAMNFDSELLPVTRSAGVLLHPTSLPGPFGVGAAGTGAVVVAARRGRERAGRRGDGDRRGDERATRLPTGVALRHRARALHLRLSRV